MPLRHQNLILTQAASGGGFGNGDRRTAYLDAGHGGISSLLQARVSGGREHINTC